METAFISIFIVELFLIVYRVIVADFKEWPKAILWDGEERRDKEQTQRRTSL